MGTNTDPYQPAEGKCKLTRQIIEVLAERRNPFSILTKSPLVLRDLNLLTEAARVTTVNVDFSIGTLDEHAWSISEPGTAHPKMRIDAVRRLADAGVPSGVLMAPILPGLSDREDQLEAVVAAASEAGARFIAGMYLHLRGPLKAHYLEWLARSQPYLLRRHQQSYATSAYAPADAPKRLTETIQLLVEKHDGPVTDRTWAGKERESEPDTEKLQFIG
jgi:DNA repair photolyase